MGSFEKSQKFVLVSVKPMAGLCPPPGVGGGAIMVHWGAKMSTNGKSPQK